ncbi:MAG: LacI family DNA-binding transcriptional regulator [Proteiniphilum sp.]|uniref:LacI family DNA-binding transcriptional regulator n=1 Tax=Proteiniphilum sp. TaxID=1926877 RepID=UPI002ABC09BE|nr:LacI family DNA-binding transcriptional regulator [Proteiniphilum sp.]MDY9917926.1 LacI family DNA-binding transcriptional regulator [Proteiniphilum sp.]
MEKVSLKVIAKELGVSAATVSLVLNGKNKNGRVSEEMSKKIIDKAAELHYIPNSLAKGLKMGHSKSIGLIVADISNVFFGTLALHIQNYAEKEGYTVIIGNTNEKLKEMEKIITFLNSRQVDGLIITPAEGSEVLIESVLKGKKPLVLVDRGFPDLNVPSVLINNYEICYRSTKQLIDQGFKNPAFITYRQDQFHTNERKRGFIEAMKDAGLFTPDHVKEVSYQYLNEDMDKAISQLLKCEKQVDAIFFATNTISMAGVKSLFKRGMLIQKDIQVMCFDETDAINLFPFRVPFIKQPIEEMAKSALELLIDQIEKKEVKNQKLFLEAELIT